MPEQRQGAAVNDAPGFDHLIAPLTPQDFLRDYWETQPAHMARKDPGYYAGLFSTERLETVLRHAMLKANDLRVVLQQNEVPPGRYTQADGSLHLNQIYKAYGEGHTLVINSVQRFDPALARLATALRDLMCFGVEVNVYLTPPGTQGLHPHYDTHDVFVLQIEGSKTWRLYGRGEESPLLNTFQPVIPAQGLAGKSKAVELHAGDLLYLPRGEIHDAEATQEHSMHLTLGIYPVQWVDLLQTALNQHALRDVRFRRAVPVGYLNYADLRAHVNEELQVLLKDFAARAPLHTVHDAQEGQFIRKAAPLADGQLRHIHEASRLTLDSRVVKRALMRCRVAVDGDQVRLQFPGNVFRATIDYQAALVLVAGTDGPVRVRDFPGPLDDGRRVVLAQRLVRAGLLQIAPAGGEA